MDSQIKSIGKAVTWRVAASGVTYMLVYTATNRIDISSIVAGTEIVCKLILYYLHERIWGIFGDR